MIRILHFLSNEISWRVLFLSQQSQVNHVLLCDNALLLLTQHRIFSLYGQVPTTCTARVPLGFTYSDISRVNRGNRILFFFCFMIILSKGSFVDNSLVTISLLFKEVIKNYYHFVIFPIKFADHYIKLCTFYSIPTLLSCQLKKILKIMSPMKTESWRVNIFRKLSTVQWMSLTFIKK